MNRISFAAATAVTLVLALAGAAGAQSTAPRSMGVSDINELPHPAHIHNGSCAALGDVVAPLQDVTLVAGSDRVGASTTTVDMKIKDILGSPHAIMAHASAQDLGTYIACADLKGDPSQDALVVALDEQNGSGFAGVAFLRSEDGSTLVELSLTGPAASSGSGAPSGSMEPGATMAPMTMAPASQTPVGAESVTIKDFKFGPDMVTIKAGTTVTWTNQDSTQHTVTADDGSFDGGPLAQGQTFSHTFDTAGTFTYHCKIHPTMTATVTVQ